MTIRRAMDQSMIYDKAALIMRSLQIKSLMIASFDVYLESERPELGVSIHKTIVLIANRLAARDIPLPGDD